MNEQIEASPGVAILVEARRLIAQARIREAREILEAMSADGDIALERELLLGNVAYLDGRFDAATAHYRQAWALRSGEAPLPDLTVAVVDPRPPELANLILVEEQLARREEVDEHADRVSMALFVALLASAVVLLVLARRAEAVRRA